MADAGQPGNFQAAQMVSFKPVLTLAGRKIYGFDFPQDPFAVADRDFRTTAGIMQ